MGACDFILWTWLENGEHASFLTLVPRRSRHYAFTLAFGAVRDVPKFLVLVRLIHQPIGNRETLRENFDLSKCRSLRSLEITGENIARRSNFIQIFFEDQLSTITSPVFSEVVIVLQDNDIRDFRLFRCGLFSIVQGMYEVKPLRLVFSLEIWEGDRERATEGLKRCIDAEVVQGGLEFLPHPPVTVFNTYAARNRFA